jgi:hypothetical protein
MITEHKYTTEYTNTTDQVVMLADGREVLAVGAEEIKAVKQEISEKYPSWNEDLPG